MANRPVAGVIPSDLDAMRAERDALKDFIASTPFDEIRDLIGFTYAYAKYIVDMADVNLKIYKVERWVEHAHTISAHAKKE